MCDVRCAMCDVRCAIIVRFYNLNRLNHSGSASNLVYVFSNLRKIVTNHGKSFDDDDTISGKVAFVQPDLIITQKASERTFQTTHMKDIVTAADILKFVELNRQYLRMDEKSGSLVFDKTASNKEKFYFEKGIDTLSRFDADIIEFDDRRANDGSSSELVYSIVVNR